MKLMLNGRSLESECETLLALLHEQGIDTDQRGIAVAIDNQVITRQHWESRALAEGEVIEVITAMQGG
ncbi:MAG TPA: sulfur carrier protein ThiS [Candidatus Kapabacteria bacterium]|nr:sulfur carrier protein ThiS [Candidatus Kapabacteria bacterium]